MSEGTPGYEILREQIILHCRTFANFSVDESNKYKGYSERSKSAPIVSKMLLLRVHVVSRPLAYFPRSLAGQAWFGAKLYFDPSRRILYAARRML
jgi:hypothetical protein